jgi:hypothetical protein
MIKSGGGAPGVAAFYTDAFELNTAAGGAIYVIAAVGAILLACFLAAQRLLPPVQADAIATASLLQLGAAAVVLLAFVAFAAMAKRPTGFMWLAALAVAGAVMAALSVFVLPSSSPLSVFQGSALGFGSTLRTGIGSEIGAAIVLAASAAAAAGVDYSTGNMRADRTGAIVSLTACSAVVSAGVFFVLLQLDQAYGFLAAAGGAVAILATLVATSWAGARIADKIGDYRGSDSWSDKVDKSVDLAVEQTKVVVSIAMVASVVLPLYVILSRKKEGSETKNEWDSVKIEVAAVCVAIASFLPLVSIAASLGLVANARTPGLYAFIATCILAAAVYSAGVLIPWTGGIIWLAILAALAMLANMVLNREDGGERKLTVMLMLVAGVAASQMLGNKLFALLPIALVAAALFSTGRSVAPAAIVAGAILWSVADDATTNTGVTTTEAGAIVDPAVLIGRTCTTLAAVTLVLTQLFYLAGDVLPTVLSGLSIFGVDQTRIARGLGAVVLVTMLSLQARDLTRFIIRS